ncbi:hypothetical protein DES36_11915 [Alkalibaculum bacchi]|uniref:Uncharacterized protein n=1 Tax=Alkalibaculum bacchi TaxID=645887 RepID=A0A366HZZ6_9FIRM|nr:hypothetical protein [Alkalibaculum bacchi]RBP59290.1 hypothetical protein DES36_11915 [Alkalibaculum bacchi]
MIILSYDRARRSLLMMSLYLVGVSLVIKGLGYFLELNFLSIFQSLLDGTKFSLKVPKFNMDSFSFSLLINAIEGKIQEILQTVIPTASMLLGSIESTGSIVIKKPKIVNLFIKA